MQELILARHAESVFNVRGVLNGDPRNTGGLSDRGRTQAETLGRALAEIDIDMCVTTDFDRTRETADIALGGRNVPRQVIPELNDPGCGLFELRPYTEFNAWRFENGPDVPIPGETTTERENIVTLARAFELLTARPERRVLAVLHGFCINWLLSSIAREQAGEIGFAEPHRLTTEQIAETLTEVRDDPYPYFTVGP